MSHPDAPDFANWVCPLPLRDYPTIVMGHGGGGSLSADLIQHVFLPHFGNPVLTSLGDSSVLPPPSGRLAISTDSFVVRPLFFPGGSIAELAINGTVNDLAMSGAQPLYLSAAFILEEGFPIAQLAVIAERMGIAARQAGVQIITGDTKVVERGHGDGCYINTTGVGVVPDPIDIRPANARPGDVLLLSGTIGDHGMAVLSVREGLSFETRIQSDCAPLHTLVQTMLAAAPGAVHVLRDPTRGGVASSLHEIAASAGVGIEIDEAALPVNPEVAAACELLGLDPLYVANEGKLLAIVHPASADAILHAMRQHPLGANATRIGHITAHRPGLLLARTPLGATRLVPLQIGEQLPRIC